MVDERFVERVHRRGMHVHVWTIDDPAEMSRLLDLGVDGIMTDRPAVLRDVLIGRGRVELTTIAAIEPAARINAPTNVAVGPASTRTRSASDRVTARPTPPP